jgi:hypothetical protein
MAARAGNRMQARQTYRTMNRMQRRRGFTRDAMTPDEPAYAPPPPVPAPAPPPAPTYVDELQALAGLHEQGAITDEEYDLKKRQILEL